MYLSMLEKFHDDAEKSVKFAEFGREVMRDPPRPTETGAAIRAGADLGKAAARRRFSSTFCASRSSLESSSSAGTSAPGLEKII